MNDTTKTEVIHDLAAGELNQREIAEKHDMTQQNVSYYLKANKLEVERIKGILLSQLAHSMVRRAVKESRKADTIVNAYDDGTMTLPTKEELEYLKIHDGKVSGLIKGIIAPQTSDTNINVTKNENKTIINSDVMKMFHNGAKAMLETTVEEIDEEEVNMI